LVEQKKAMDDLLATKEKLIQDYSNEVKSKDDEYVKELKRQSEEIELLAERMNKQYMAFQVSFVDELELIEKAFVEERQELISKNYKDIESLMDNRRKNEGYIFSIVTSLEIFWKTEQPVLMIILSSLKHSEFKILKNII
jgi:dynein regulatory complex protein 1